MGSLSITAFVFAAVGALLLAFSLGMLRTLLASRIKVKSKRAVVYEMKNFDRVHSRFH